MMQPLKPDPKRNTAETYREVVLVQHETSRKAHQELFSFDDGRYVMSSGDIIGSLLSLAQQGVDKIHIAADWEHLLMMALWTPTRPRIFDVIRLLKKSGAGEAELLPFRTSDISDLFPWLYYGRKFDILRRICNEAKAKCEYTINRKHLHLVFHLVSDDTLRIVASSL
jgi:hypothetical protein